MSQLTLDILLTIEKETGIKNELCWIPVDKLVPHPRNPRRGQPDKLESIVQSMKDDGYLLEKPMLVRPYCDGNYQIIGGHTRHQAAKMAGLEKVLCVIEEMDDDKAILRLGEDNRNDPFSWFSECIYIAQNSIKGSKKGLSRKDLVTASTGKVGDAAESEGRRKGDVGDFLLWLEAQTVNVDGLLNPEVKLTSHLYAIHKAPDRYWLELAELLVENQWSVKETESIVAAVKETLPDGSVREAIGILASSKKPADRFRWETNPESFKKNCQLFNDDFILYALAMDLTGLSVQEISDRTGRSIPCVERALNPQFVDRCKPFKKWWVNQVHSQEGVKYSDENNNHEMGETLLTEECDAVFFSTAYNLERKELVYHWRATAWKQAAIVFREREELQAIALANAQKDKQKSIHASEGLEKLGIPTGMGMHGMILALQGNEEKHLNGETIVEDDWLLYASFAEIANFCRQDSLWGCGLSEEEPRSNWIESGKFYAKCVKETHKCWESEIAPALQSA